MMCSKPPSPLTDANRYRRIILASPVGLSYSGVRRARGGSNRGSTEPSARHTDRLDQLRNHIIHDAMDGTSDFGRPVCFSPSP
nr:hypothetical protein XACLD7_8550008 [Xanthomonas citri pv. citri]